MLADGVADKLAHTLHELTQIDGFGRQRLAAREGEQALGQVRGAPQSLFGGVDIAYGIGTVLDQPLAQQLKITHCDHEQIVEVMRDAARQLPDGFHLLALPQRLFGLLMLGHLRLQAAIEFGQIECALFQLGIGTGQGTL